MAWTSDVPEPQRAQNGAWLCSTAGCSMFAAMQTARACGGCEEFPDEHTHPLFACADHEESL